MDIVFNLTRLIIFVTYLTFMFTMIKRSFAFLNYLSNWSHLRGTLLLQCSVCLMQYSFIVKCFQQYGHKNSINSCCILWCFHEADLENSTLSHRLHITSSGFLCTFICWYKELLVLNDWSHMSHFTFTSSLWLCICLAKLL